MITSTSAGAQMKSFQFNFMMNPPFMRSSSLSLSLGGSALKVFCLTSLVLSLSVITLPACASSQLLLAQSSVTNQVLIAQSGIVAFGDHELPKRLSEKPKFRELADSVLNNWSKKKYDAALEDAKKLAQSAKPKRDEVAQMTVLADSVLKNAGKNGPNPSETADGGMANSDETGVHSRNKSGALQLIAYQSVNAGGRATVDDAIARLAKLVSVLTSSKTSEEDRAFAANLAGQALRTRKIAGGILDSDAPLVRVYAHLEFSLKHWETAIKEYEYWIGIFESKGKNPPADELPEVLAELGIAYNSLKKLPKAESLFARACDATMKLNGSNITPQNRYDVADFLIFNLLNQGKLDEAKERAQQHLKFKEASLGLNSPKLVEELNRYADLFEQAGETSFSFSLRTRAGRVSPR